jgi:hypothetical protein
MGTIYEVRVSASDGKATSDGRIKEQAFTTLTELAANQPPRLPAVIQRLDTGRRISNPAPWRLEAARYGRPDARRYELEAAPQAVKVSIKPGAFPIAFFRRSPNA